MKSKSIKKELSGIQTLKSKYQLPFSLIMGAYIVVSLFLFSSAILLWTGVSFARYVENDRVSKLKNLNLMINNLYEIELLQIDYSLNEIQNFYQVNESSTDTDYLSLENHINYFNNSKPNFYLDLLLISGLDNEIKFNGSSGLFEIERFFDEITSFKDNIDEGGIINLVDDSLSLVVILKSMKIVNEKSGEFIGYLYGGRVLNGSTTFLDKVKEKSNSETAIILSGNDLVSSTDQYNSKNVELLIDTIKEEKLSDVEKSVDTKVGNQYLTLSYSMIADTDHSSDIKVGVVSVNMSLQELRSSFFVSTILLLFSIICFYLITILVLSRLTLPPLNNLLRYLDGVESSGDPGKINSGLIKEFNLIGASISSMMQRLDSSREHLLLEIAERKKRESEIKQLNSELDDRVIRRTKELNSVNEKLNSKIKEYEELVNELTTLSKAVQQSGNQIIITDFEGVIEYINPAFTSQTGYSSEDALGKKMNLLWSGEQDDKFYDDLWNVINGGNTWSGEIINRTKTGELIWVSATISPVIDQNEELINFVAIEEDISIRKSMEKQLLEAKENAESADRAKSAFLANMSHEIRTPMNSIIGFLQVAMESEKLPDQLEEYLSISLKSAESLLALINDILDTSKLEAGRMQIESHAFDLMEVLDDAVESIRLKAEQKGLQLALDFELDPHLCILGDSAKLKQVLLNLLSNAVKFTEDGWINIHVERSEDDFIIFTVEDSGIGMTDKQSTEIFKPFSQADESTARRYGGTGLGTTISKQLVELMGGEISVDSKIDRGSVFTFTIPLLISECSEPLDDELHDTGKYNSDNETEIRNISILLAEDVKENADLMLIKLGSSGHKITVVENGKEAVEKFISYNYDIIFMDVHMPVMDGLEAVRRIRKREKEKGQERTPIIALTASIMKEDYDKCINAGMDDVLGKPIDFNKLMHLMQKSLSSRSEVQLLNKEKVNANNSVFDLHKKYHGVNVEKGIKVWQNNEVYIDSLNNFINSNLTTFDKLNRLLVSGDLIQASEITHSLKGTAGNLSLELFEEIIAELHKKIKTDSLLQIESLVEKARNEFTKLISSIKAIDSDFRTESIAPTDVSKHTLLHSLSEFKKNIKVGNYDPSLLSEIRSNLHSRIPSEIMQKFIDRLDHFDFAEVNKIISDIMEILEDE